MAGSDPQFGMFHYVRHALATVVHFAGVAQAREKLGGGS